MGRTAAGRVILSVVLLALVAVAAGCRPAAPPPPPPSVIVYGDSLTTQSYDNIAAGLARPGWETIIRQYPGTALCDWLAQMNADGNLNARLVVMEFAGNMLTSCTQGRGELADVYQQDSTTAADLWQSRGVRVLWVSPPGAQGTTGPAPLTAIDQSVASQHGQSFVDAGATLQAPDGTWPLALPCLSFEITDGFCNSDGTIHVRTSATNNHLCPVDSGLSPCPVYSSGVFRWSGAMINAARELY